MDAALGVDGSVGYGYRFWAGHVTPQHHRTALAIVGSAGVDRGALLHSHFCGLV